MKLNRDILDLRRASRWLTAWSALALLLGTHVTQAAEVVFNDGLTHTINDASFQNDTLTVENSTKLIINPGAVLGGAGETSGMFLVNDSSTLTIHDATSGGEGLASGGVQALNSSKVTIHGGKFGSAGILSGHIRLWSTGGSTINGGAVQLEVTPELRLERTAAGLKLSWSQSAVDYRLQSTGGMSTASEWTVWPEAPVLEGDRWVVQLPPAKTASGNQLFRLHKP